MPTKSKKKPLKRFVVAEKAATGRPFFDGRDQGEILSKLRLAWDIGASDLEACASADITTSSLHRFLEKNPLFREERDRRKEKMAIMSRKVILGAIADGNIPVAQWYLERRKKDEFSKIDTMVNTQVNLQVPILLDTRINAGNTRRQGE